MGIKTETYTNEVIIMFISGLKTYFICGRVAPDINPIKTRPEGPVAVMKTSTFVLQTDMINESNYQVDEKKLQKLSTYTFTSLNPFFPISSLRWPSLCPHCPRT